jgi:ferredoxin-fold anticodon binding domain-containing protein
MKDIIYPTIKRQFDKLHMWSKTSSKFKHPYYDLSMVFRDDDDEEIMNYSVTQNELWVDYKYFMLNYFGEGKKNKEFFKEIFIDLLNDYFEKTKEDIVVDKDMRFYFYTI